MRFFDTATPTTKMRVICLWACLGAAPVALAAPGDAYDRALQAKSVTEAFTLLGVQTPEPGKRVLLEVPDIVDGGAKVPVKVTSKIPGTDWIAVFAERNLTPLVEAKDFSPGADRAVSLTVNLAQTSKIRAVVRAGGKYFQVSREVKVASTDCDKK